MNFQNVSPRATSESLAPNSLEYQICTAPELFDTLVSRFFLGGIEGREDDNGEVDGRVVVDGSNGGDGGDGAVDNEEMATITLAPPT